MLINVDKYFKNFVTWVIILSMLSLIISVIYPEYSTLLFHIFKAIFTFFYEPLLTIYSTLLAFENFKILILAVSLISFITLIIRILSKKTSEVFINKK